MTSPIEHLAALTIGTIESVAPDRLTAILELDAAQGTALNTGVPTAFPRINGYVLIPNEGGALVGLVVWLGVERSAFPKRTGLRDFGLIDLPFPLRKMYVSPVGTLAIRHIDGGRHFVYGRGAPPDLLPAIVGATSPVAGRRVRGRRFGAAAERGDRLGDDRD